MKNSLKILLLLLLLSNSIFADDKTNSISIYELKQANVERCLKIQNKMSPEQFQYTVCYYTVKLPLDPISSK